MSLVHCGFGNVFPLQNSEEKLSDANWSGLEGTTDQTD